MPAKPWPYPTDKPLARARRVGIAYREHLLTTNPELCAEVDRVMAEYGVTWVQASTVDYADHELVDTKTAAEIAGVGLRTIYLWKARGHLYELFKDEKGRMWFQVGHVRTAAARRLMYTAPSDRLRPDKGTM